jgi:protein-tyrosine-phosphatase
MFAAVLQRALQSAGKQASVESAGYKAETGATASEEWATLLDRTGIDLGGHRTRHIASIENLDVFDLIICVNEAAVEAVTQRGANSTNILFVNRAKGGIPDPYQQGLQAYKDCYRSIVEATANIVDAI